MENLTYVLDAPKNTTGTCAALAIAATTECKYDTALACIKEIGFKPHRGTPMFKASVPGIVAKYTGAKVTRVYHFIEPTKFLEAGGTPPTTLRRVLKRFATGRYTVSVRGHIFSLVDGKIIDNGYYLDTPTALKMYGRHKITRVDRYDLAAVEPTQPVQTEQPKPQTQPGTQLRLF